MTRDQSRSQAWRHARTVEHQGQAFFLWTRPHHEGFDAWQVTRSQAEPDRSWAAGCYTSLAGLARVTGIDPGQPAQEPGDQAW
jgi:hypothetical protein